MSDHPPIFLTPTTRAQDVPVPGYVIPEGLEHISDALRACYADGVSKAVAAATWTTDGNGDPWSYARILRQLEDGDPAADDFLPAMPDLSGVWGDDATPSSLAREHLPDDAADTPEHLDTAEDALSDAWEAGCDAVWSECVEAELVGALPDPDPIAAEILDASERFSDALETVQGLEMAPVQVSQVLRAIYVEHLRRHGASVAIGRYGVSLTLSGPFLYAWSRGDVEGLSNYGAAWPCSILSSDAVEGLRVGFDTHGNLSDLDVEGLYYSNTSGLYYASMDDDGQGIGDGIDVPADELSAMTSDILSVALPIDHSAWYTTVGQFLDPGDPRREISDRLASTSNV